MTLLMQRVPWLWASSHVAELLFRWVYAGQFPHHFPFAHSQMLTAYAMQVWAILIYKYRPPDIIQGVWDVAAVAWPCFLLPELKEDF